MEPQRGFFSRLFDTTFQDFITPSIARVVYIILIVISGLWALVFMGGALFSGRGGTVVLGLVIGPLAFLLGVLASRIYLELVLVIFRIAENTSHLRGAEGTPAAGTPPPPAP